MGYIRGSRRGEDEAVTDKNGQVNFQRIEFSISWLHRLTKPLLILVPASCGPGWEIYGESKFQIHMPAGYTLRFDNAAGKKTDAENENHDGIQIYDPAVTVENGFVGLSIFNKRKDFDYTLKAYKK